MFNNLGWCKKSGDPQEAQWASEDNPEVLRRRRVAADMLERLGLAATMRNVQDVVEIMNNDNAILGMQGVAGVSREDIAAEIAAVLGNPAGGRMYHVKKCAADWVTGDVKNTKNWKMGGGVTLQVADRGADPAVLSTSDAKSEAIKRAGKMYGRGNVLRVLGPAAAIDLGPPPGGVAAPVDPWAAAVQGFHSGYVTSHPRGDAMAAGMDDSEAAAVADIDAAGMDDSEAAAGADADAATYEEKLAHWQQRMAQVQANIADARAKKERGEPNSLKSLLGVEKKTVKQKPHPDGSGGMGRRSSQRRTPRSVGRSVGLSSARTSVRGSAAAADDDLGGGANATPQGESP